MVVLHSAAPALDLGFVRRLESLVHVGHSLVQTEPLCLEGTDHIDCIGIRAGVLHKAGAHVAALYGIVAREAKQCDLLGLILGQRQCAVVLQQDAALFAHPLTHVLNAVQQLGSGGVVGFESIQVSAVGVLGHELGALGAQELVNVSTESVHDGRGADTERQQRRRARRGGRIFSYSCFSSLCILVYIVIACRARYFLLRSLIAFCSSGRFFSTVQNRIRMTAPMI